MHVFTLELSPTPPADSSPCKKCRERRLKRRDRADVILSFGYSQSLASSCMSLSRFWAAIKNRKSIDDVAKDIIDDFHPRCASLLPPLARLRRVSFNEDHLTVVLHHLLTSPPMLNYIKKVHQGGSSVYHPVPCVLLLDYLSKHGPRINRARFKGSHRRTPQKISPSPQMFGVLRRH